MTTSLSAMKIGRYGSSAVNWLIQAPLIPRVSNTNGATQQSEPTIAANALAHNCLVAVCMGCSLHHVLRYGGNYASRKVYNWPHCPRGGRECGDRPFLPT